MASDPSTADQRGPGENSLKTCEDLLSVPGVQNERVCALKVAGCLLRADRSKPLINPPSSDSEVLERVKNFLPRLMVANEALEDEINNGSECDIENIKEGDHHIKMELALVRYDTTDSSEDEEGTSDDDEDKRPILSPTGNHFTCAGSTDQADVKGKPLITEIIPPMDEDSHGNRRKRTNSQR